MWVRTATFALFCAACSSGGSGGGYAPGSGGSATVFPSGPLLDCQPGDFDLAGSSGPGLTVVPLPTVTPTNPTKFMGLNAVESNPISVCVPPDTVSLTLYADSTLDAVESSYVASGLGETVDSSSLETVLRFQSPELMLPKGPEVQLHPGQHTFKLANDVPGELTPKIAIRRGWRADQSQFGINLILVDGSGIDEFNIQAFGDASGVFEQIYAQVGVTINALGIGFVHDSSLAVLPQGSEQQLTENIVSSEKAPLLENAINFYLVRELLSGDTAGQLLGHAMGVPGVRAIPRKSGVVLSVDAHRRGLDLDFGAIWVTAAHEGAHWHGLRHTSERWGTIQDMILDTPECTRTRDVNHDGVVDMFECSNAGAHNLMFWIYDMTNPPTELTPGQGFVLNSALSMNPQ